MTNQPILLCTGPDATVAATEARQAAALFRRRRAVVLCAWAPPKLPFSPIVAAAWDAVFELPEELAAAAHRAANEAAQSACDVLAAAGWTAEPRVVHDDRHPHRVILETADEIDAALIVAAAREDIEGPPGALGRVTRALAHHTSRPLLVVPPEGVPPDADASALIAFDGSSSAGHALDQAARLLAPRPAIVATAWEPCPAVVPIGPMSGAPVATAGYDPASLDERVSAAASGTAGAGTAVLERSGWRAAAEAVRTGRGVWRALVDLAELRDTAVVVTGTRGHGPVVAALIGSVAEGILRHSGRPVLLVPAP